jgi:hypothetical protein
MGAGEDGVLGLIGEAGVRQVVFRVKISGN